MKKITVIFFLCLFALFLSACSDALEGIGIKPEPVGDAILTGADGSLTVSWDKIYLADSYLVYCSDKPDIPGEHYAIVENTSITIPNLLNDVVYYVWVMPSNKRGAREPQKVFSGSIPLSMPTGVMISIPRGDAIQISWDAVVLADGYEVFCKTSPIPPSTADTPDQTVSTNSAVLSDLNQAHYYIWVRAINSRGKSALSDMAQDIFSLGRPAKPTLRKTANDTIEARWNSVALANEYEIFCKTNPVSPSASDAPDHIVSTNSAVLGGLDHPNYYIWVRAKNSRGKSALSDMAQDSFIVSGFKAATITAHSITLEWSSLKDASGYIIYRSASEGGIYDRIDTAAIIGASFTDTGLDVFIAYYYRISAVIGGGECMQSGAVSAVTQLPSPDNVRVTDASSGNSISLAWDAVGEASGYNVYRSTDENGTYDKINASIITQVSYSDMAVIPDTAYFYKICAVIGDIEGVWSSSVSASIITIDSIAGLAEKLAWLQSNAQSGGSYTLEVGANESIGPHALSYSGRTNIAITLKGIGAARTINLASNGSLFTVGTGVTLILDNNIALQGRGGNTASLVYVNSGGTLRMNAGSAIAGNTYASSSLAFGGGLYIDASASFTMSGGTISGNTVNGYGGGVCVYGTFAMSGGTISGNTAMVAANGRSAFGGGVYVNEAATFNKTGGTITGYATAASAGNKSTANDGTIRNNDGHAVYAGTRTSVRRKNTTAGVGANLYFSNGSSSGDWD